MLCIFFMRSIKENINPTIDPIGIQVCVNCTGQDYRCSSFVHSTATCTVSICNCEGPEK
jgi:hypothetical protein